MRPLPEQGPRRAARVWVVAADAARARIFRARQRDGALTEIEDFINPDVLHGMKSLRADREGHATDAAGGGHSMQRNATEDRQVAADFARRVARRLALGRRRGEVDRIYLMAEPRLLGVVRESLDRPTRRLLAGEIDRDLTRQTALAIRRRLPARL